MFFARLPRLASDGRRKIVDAIRRVLGAETLDPASAGTEEAVPMNNGASTKGIITKLDLADYAAVASDGKLNIV